MPLFEQRGYTTHFEFEFEVFVAATLLFVARNAWELWEPVQNNTVFSQPISKVTRNVPRTNFISAMAMYPFEERK